LHHLYDTRRMSRLQEAGIGDLSRGWPEWHMASEIVREFRLKGQVGVGLPAKPTQMSRMCEVLLNFCCLIVGGEGAAGESCFECVAERTTRLQSSEQAERLMIDPSVIDGVFEAMDGQVDGRTAHFWKTHLLGLFSLGDGIAHNVAGRGLLMNGEDQLVDGVD